MIYDVCWTILWHNPTYKRRPLDHFWWGSDKNISKMLIDESWTKSRPIDQFGRNWTEMYPTWQSLKCAGLSHGTIRRTRVPIWPIWAYKRWLLDHFWEGLDGNIFNMILGDCQTKSRPIRTYKRPLFDHFFWRLDGNRLKMIPRVYWTTSRPFWTYKRRLFFLFFARIGWKYIQHDPWCRGNEGTILHFSMS